MTRTRILPDRGAIIIDLPDKEEPIREIQERILPDQGTRERWMNEIVAKVLGWFKLL